MSLRIHAIGGARSSACVAKLEVAVRNDGGLPVDIQELSIAHLDEAQVFVHVAPLEADAAWNIPVSFHVAGKYRITVDAERNSSKIHLVAVESGDAWAPTAESQCRRGNRRNSSPSVCTCTTGDAGRVCYDGLDCEGPCLFDRTVAVDPKRGASLLWHREYDVGHCAAQRRPLGCFTVLEPGAAEHAPRDLRGPHTGRCFDVE